MPLSSSGMMAANIRSFTVIALVFILHDAALAKPFIFSDIFSNNQNAQQIRNEAVSDFVNTTITRNGLAPDEACISTLQNAVNRACTSRDRATILACVTRTTTSRGASFMNCLRTAETNRRRTTTTAAPTTEEEENNAVINMLENIVQTAARTMRVDYDPFCVRYLSNKFDEICGPRSRNWFRPNVGRLSCGLNFQNGLRLANEARRCLESGGNPEDSEERDRETTTNRQEGTSKRTSRVQSDEQRTTERSTTTSTTTTTRRSVSRTPTATIRQTTTTTTNSPPSHSQTRRPSRMNNIISPTPASTTTTTTTTNSPPSRSYTRRPSRVRDFLETQARLDQ